VSAPGPSGAGGKDHGAGIQSLLQKLQQLLARAPAKKESTTACQPVETGQSCGSALINWVGAAVLALMLWLVKFMRGFSQLPRPPRMIPQGFSPISRLKIPDFSE
jgi:hypothetical protein